MGYAIVSKNDKYEIFPVPSGSNPEAVAEESGGELVDYRDSQTEARFLVAQLNYLGGADSTWNWC
jgi:hypothetical protein